MGYSLDPISANRHPGISVLVNKFDIRDEAKLSEMEITFVSESKLTSQSTNPILSNTWRFVIKHAIINIS